MHSRNLLRIGHRGASGHAPENTLASVEAAIAIGVDFVEVDVRRTSDGHLVVIHDNRVDRTTNGSGCVSRMALSELRELDAGAGERIPTVNELIAATNGRVGLMLEIKASRIARQLHEEVVAAKFSGPVLYASFAHAEIGEIRRLSPSAATIALVEGEPLPPPACAIAVGATYIGADLESLTETFVANCEAIGLPVLVYTVNDLLDIQWVQSLGVKGIITDFPEHIAMES